MPHEHYRAFVLAMMIEVPQRPSAEFKASTKRLQSAMRESQRLGVTLIDEHHLADAAACAEDLLAIIRRARASQQKPKGRK